MATYDKGDKVTLTATFKNTAGTLTDPTAITLTVREPDNTVTTYTYAGAQVVKDSTGVYHYDYTIDQTGAHSYRWEGTGALVTAEESRFFVDRQKA